MVGVFSLSTGALLDMAMGPYAGKGTGENALLRQLLHVFNRGDIVVADRYYASFFVLTDLMRIGADVVMPNHGTRICDFRRGKRIGDGDHLVQWKKPKKPDWMSHEEYVNYPENITVRETKTTLNRPGFRVLTQIIITTFVDEKRISPNDLSKLYSFRWHVELNLRSVKTIMKMDILRGKTPEIVRKEIWAHILAYNLVRKVMMQAASRYQRSPREMSFKLALQMISAFRHAGALREKNPQLYSEFLKSIISKRTGTQKRTGQPRVVKRRPKKYSLMLKPRAMYLNKV